MSELSFSDILPGGFREGAIYRPAASEPITKEGPFYANFVCPLRERLHSAPENNYSAIAPVVHLLFGRRPFTVFWRITKIIINSIYGHAVRAIPHIGKEILKSKPSLTNCNPPAKIAFAAINIRIPASLNHGCPSPVCRGLTHAMGRGGNSGGVSELLFMEASARLAAAGSQIIARCNVLFATLTNAFPCEIATLNAVLAEHGQSPKNLSGKVNSFSHKSMWHNRTCFATSKAGG